MGILLLLIGIIGVIFAIGIQKYRNGSDYIKYVQSGVGLIGGIFIFLGILILLVALPGIGYQSMIYNKVKMYEKENVRLDKEINKDINAYERNEERLTKIYGMNRNLNDVSYLRCRDRINKKLVLYDTNAKLIRSLKADAIDHDFDKWLVYFG